MSIKAVLWDMDGVLIDSEPGYNVAVGEMMAKLGKPFGEREIAAITGASFRNIGRILGFEFSIEELYTEALTKSLKANVTGLVDGAETFLKRFKARGIPQAIGSSSPRSVVDFAVSSFGMAQYLDLTITGTESPTGKPEPDIYLMCADKLGVEPRDCLVIEDSINGVKAGLNAGMVVAAFTGTMRHGFDLSGAGLTLTAYDDENWSKVEELFR